MKRLLILFMTSLFFLTGCSDIIQDEVKTSKEVTKSNSKVIAKDVNIGENVDLNSFYAIYVTKISEEELTLAVDSSTTVEITYPMVIGQKFKLPKMSTFIEIDSFDVKEQKVSLTAYK